MSNFKVIKTGVLALVILLAVSFQAAAQTSLPRSIPELEGVSSAGIIDFLNAVDTGSVELHSFMFIRHGKVIAEGWWEPFGPEYKHIMYSASKTFTATAIGLAISENRLKLTDKVISFFPYSLPDSISDYMKDLTVQNLLMMSVGQDPAPMSGGNSDWIRSFIENAPVHKPGTVFLYNNMATFMLSAIVQQVTGQTTFDYLQPRIFEPLGIHNIDWDVNPQGINLGMIGLRLHTEDLGKFGQLLLQNGKWGNKQLIPAEWVALATSFKIESNDPGNKNPKEFNDWMQGYCFQMWRGRNNSVRLDGMAGQYSIIFRDKDAVVVLTANANNTQNELNLVHNYLIPAIKSDKSLAADPAKYSELQKKESSLALKTASGIANQNLESRISGKEFLMGTNNYNIQSVYLTFNNGECNLGLKRNNTLSFIKAGSESWKYSNSNTTSLLSATPAVYSKTIDAHYTIPQVVIKLAAKYAWTDNNTLEVTSRYMEESLGASTLIFRFTDANGSLRLSVEQKATGGRMPAAGATQAAPAMTGTLLNILK